MSTSKVDKEFTALVPNQQQESGLLPGRRIIKRKLRNKEVEAVFDPENFKEYLTGFSKRKQQRREYAQKKITELEKKARRKSRIQRNNKLKKQLGIPEGGQWVSASDTEDGDAEDKLGGAITYASGDVTTTVVTAEKLKLNSDEESDTSSSEENGEGQISTRSITNTQTVTETGLGLSNHKDEKRVKKNRIQSNFRKGHRRKIAKNRKKHGNKRK